MFDISNPEKLKVIDTLHLNGDYCSAAEDYKTALVDSEKFKDLMRGVDKELKEIETHIIKLKDLDYNLLEIIMLQDEIHDKYA